MGEVCSEQLGQLSLKFGESVCAVEGVREAAWPSILGVFNSQCKSEEGSCTMLCLGEGRTKLSLKSDGGNTTACTQSNETYSNLMFTFAYLLVSGRPLRCGGAVE